MPEQVFNIRQDVFGVLSKAPRASVQVWYLLMRVFPDCAGPLPLPSKICGDARKLVEAGIVIEPEKGCFQVNPEVVFVTEEPTVQEILEGRGDEARS